MSAQAELFEPRPFEVAALALGHLKKSKNCLAAADVFHARGMTGLAVGLEAVALQHVEQAEHLAMLSDFYKLGGVVS